MAAAHVYISAGVSIYARWTLTVFLLSSHSAWWLNVCQNLNFIFSVCEMLLAAGRSACVLFNVRALSNISTQHINNIIYYISSSESQLWRQMGADAGIMQTTISTVTDRLHFRSNPLHTKLQRQILHCGELETHVVLAARKLQRCHLARGDDEATLSSSTLEDGEI